LGTALENRGDFVAETDQRRLEVGAVRFQFLARVADRVLVPVDILRGKSGGVGLGGAGMPEEFVEVAALGVGLTADHGGVFFGRDGALRLEYGPGPLEARDDRFEEPVHAEGVVVDAAEIDVRGEPTHKVFAVVLGSNVTTGSSLQTRRVAMLRFALAASESRALMVFVPGQPRSVTVPTRRML